MRRYRYKDIEKQLNTLKDALERAKKIIKEANSFIKSTEDEIRYLREVESKGSKVENTKINDKLKSEKAGPELN